MNKPVFGELFLDHAEGRNAIHLYSSQPSPLEESSLGRVFVLVEFEEPVSFAETVVQALDETFTDSYYRSSDFEPEAAFERALHKVNNAVHDLINQFGEEWVYKVNAALGVVHNQNVYISYVGKIEGHLIQNASIADIVQHSQTIEVQPLKLFNTLIAGKCPDRGGVFISTANILDYMSLEKVRRTIKDQSAAEAVEAFSSSLSASDTLSNVAAFVIKFETAHMPATDLTRSDMTVGEAMGETTPKGAVDVSADSMSTLIERERATGDLLAPSIWPNIKKKLQYVGNSTQDKTEQRRAVSDNYVRSENQFVNVMKMLGVFLLNALKQLGIILLQLLQWVWKLVQTIFKNRDSISSTVGGSMSGVAGWWRRLSMSQRVFVALLALTLVIFIFSLFRKGNASERNASNSEYAEKLTDVDNKLGEAESKQIMKDDAGARASLAEATDLLDDVPTDSKAYKATGAGLAERVANLQNTLNKVTTVSPTLIADLSSTIGSASIGKIALVGNNVFAFAEGSQGVWRVNIEKKEASNVISDSSGDGVKSVENDSAATTLALVGNKSFEQFNPVLEKTADVSVGFKDDELVVTDFDLFGTRLYALATQQNRIVRLEKDGDEYNGSSSWITDGTSVSDAVSFDIDGSIYLLYKDGSMKKMDGGEASEFSVESFSPSLGGAVQLIKTDAAEPFYILNPTTKLVVVIGNDGKLQAQYTAPELEKAKSMVVNSADKKVYFVADNKVYELALP